VAFLAAGMTAEEPATTLYLVPNTHGTITGWLVDFNT
jgi:hypothetical protein